MSGFYIATLFFYSNEIVAADMGIIIIIPVALQGEIALPACNGHSVVAIRNDIRIPTITYCHIRYKSP